MLRISDLLLDSERDEPVTCLLGHGGGQDANVIPVGSRQVASLLDPKQPELWKLDVPTARLIIMRSSGLQYKGYRAGLV